ncbi:SgcJ/EcaC family oxidoreductase [Streptomyces sp. NPDC049040]|uniref:SgcJ/EcaC family oxidoreductase n=1 Tax=Streptomyces sp. NPDC049040 TaxID=3365593 RepID=UPI0037157922
MTSTTTPQAAAQHEHDRAVREVFRGMTRAWEAGDAAAFTAWYAPEAWVILPGRRLEGEEEIGTVMAGAFAGSLHGTRRNHEIERIRLISPDVALVRTRSATVTAEQDEAGSGQHETVTWVLARRDGRWLIEANHIGPAESS